MLTRVEDVVSRFSAEGDHGEKEQGVLAKLSPFFKKFFDFSSGGSRS